MKNIIISTSTLVSITCGNDLRQHINGKISYIPHVNNPEQIRFEAPKNG